MSSYVLLPAAKEDSAGIRDFYLEQAGYRVARQMVVEFQESFRFPLAHRAPVMVGLTWPTIGLSSSGRCATT